MRVLIAASACVLACAVLPPASVAGDRTDIPLKNWGGFARFRDAVYDDLERLVASGLAGRAVLNTKPMSRTEAAGIVATAIERVRRDTSGAVAERRDMEPVLERLADEFAVELAAMGVKWGGQRVPPPGMFSFYPVDHAQVRAAYASRDLSLVNNQGVRYQDGFNGGFTFDSRLQIGDVLSFYVQPDLLLNEDYGAARLHQGYAKLTLFNVELVVGRESLWWGPGYHGSLIMSNNAPPLDHVRIGAAEPFLLPFIGQWIGPTKILAFVAQLEERREHPRAKLAGMRATIAPFSFLELGVSRTVMFGGETRPEPDAGDSLRLIVDPSAGDDLGREPQLRSNNLFAIDAEVRIARVDRFFIPARDLRLYGEFGWDDTCCESNFIPLREAISGLAGIHFIGLFGQDGLEARAEYANSSRLSFAHTSFVRGYWTRGEVISHFMGTDGEDFFARVSNRFTENFMLGIEANGSVIGRTTRILGVPKERRIGGAVDVSWRFLEKFGLFSQYQIASVDNRNFRADRDGIDHLLLVELTRSFR
jgi:hypothetical protein